MDHLLILRDKIGRLRQEIADIQALDTESRDVTVPPDFATIFGRNVKALQHFDGLTYSKKKAFVQGIEGAKTVETRQRRKEKALAELKEAADQ